MRGETARALLAEAAGVGAADVPADASIGSWERWDSLMHMRLMLLIEARLGRLLTPREILAVATLAHVEALLP
jgi:acyl carrier protein